MQKTVLRRGKEAVLPALMRGWKPELTASIGAFIGRIDSFYLGTADTRGQPYIQHRGGPPGFLRVIDPRTLAFADFSGNRQYVSVGHLAANSKAFLFLMDYERGQRVKIFGTARATDDRLCGTRPRSMAMTPRSSASSCSTSAAGPRIAHSTFCGAIPKRPSLRTRPRCARAWPNWKRRTRGCVANCQPGARPRWRGSTRPANPTDRRRPNQLRSSAEDLTAPATGSDHEQQHVTPTYIGKPPRAASDPCGLRAWRSLPTSATTWEPSFPRGA